MPTISNFPSSVENIAHWIADIRLCISQRFLKWNGDTTNIIFLALGDYFKFIKTSATSHSIKSSRNKSRNYF